MEVAFIMPTPHLRKYGKASKFHLALAPLVLNNAEYAQFFREASDRGEFVILDNGAFELGHPLPPEDILTAAHKIRAKEVVLPDKPRSMSGTLRAIEEFFDFHAKVSRMIPDYRFDFMAVPQGSTLQEFSECHARLVRDYPIRTIGIPKNVGKWFKTTRAEVWKKMVKGGYINKAFHYHMLGCADLDEYRMYSKEGIVRSIDSSRQFVCGLAGIRLDEGVARYYEDRQEDFFNYTSNPYPAVVVYNIEITLQWIGKEPRGYE